MSMGIMSLYRVVTAAALSARHLDKVPPRVAHSLSHQNRARRQMSTLWNKRYLLPYQVSLNNKIPSRPRCLLPNPSPVHVQVLEAIPSVRRRASGIPLHFLGDQTAGRRRVGEVPGVMV